MRLASKFLFTTAWKTKKTLRFVLFIDEMNLFEKISFYEFRGAAMDWADILINCISSSTVARRYLLRDFLEVNPHRFHEYLIESTFQEVRKENCQFVHIVSHLDSRGIRSNVISFNDLFSSR